MRRSRSISTRRFGRRQRRVGSNKSFLGSRFTHAELVSQGDSEILLKGRPNQSEEGIATAAIQPGMLVDGVASIAPHASAGALAPRCFAAERDELGAGVDDAYKYGYAPASAYAIGDSVKVLACAPGDRVLVLIPSGQNITENDRLESNGDGMMKKTSSGVVLARSLETYDARNVVGPILIKAEVM
jgi:hypothetical protein